MDTRRGIHQFSNIPGAGSIGSVQLSNGNRFDARMKDTQGRTRESIAWFLQYLNAQYARQLTARDIFRPKIENGTRIITSILEEGFEVSDMGVNISRKAADGLIFRSNDKGVAGKVLALGTADCGNLIIRGRECSAIIHIGHQGFFGKDGIGIVENLASELKMIEGGDLRHLKLSMGPMAENLLFSEDLVIHNRFSDYEDKIKVVGPEDELRQNTFDWFPSTDDKLLIQFASLVASHISHTLEINPEQIECAYIDTTNSINRPSKAWFSYRRLSNLPKQEKEEKYGNNMTYLLT